MDAASTPADTGSNAGDDAEVDEDSGTLLDLGVRDTGSPSTPDTGSADDDAGMSGMDAGGSTGNACDDLLACCPQAPGMLQGVCMQVAAGGNVGTCTQIISLLGTVGVMCMGSMGPVDAGPLGPNCMDLLACCSSLGAGAGPCMSQANMGNESSCAQQISIYQMIGQCGGDGGLPGFDVGPRDAGVFRRDALPPGDAEDLDTGTSSTSTTADAGPSD